ncbi:hypothetical protein GUITHDRAFT_46085, partial [Guillardia theta CCMP2712]
SKPEKFFLTTAIAYLNGVPHIGHAYEAITADIIARYYRSLGCKVFFLTGSDEHGQKIAATASTNGEAEIELCDRHVKIFADLYDKLDISFDRFIRTSSDDHKKVACHIFEEVLRAGDIYLGNYSGWYNVREETFVPEGKAREAENMNFTDPVTGLPLKKLEEPSYFFRLSRQDQVKKHILSHPDFIQPTNARNEILQRLELPLRDLSISRTSFSWGIPVPNDSKHVMYVWFDALINYLSGVDWPDGARSSNWPCDVHLIGKDIMWFHSVIWPSMLLSAGVQLPTRIYGHGFVNDRLGRKMSKSLNNVEDPFALLER